jgi:hypothetical protein
VSFSPPILASDRSLAEFTTGTAFGPATDAVVRLGAGPGKHLTVALHRSLAFRSSNTSATSFGGLNASRLQAATVTVALLSWSSGGGSWGIDALAGASPLAPWLARNVTQSGGTVMSAFNVTFAEDQAIAWIDVMSLAVTFNQSDAIAALVALDPPYPYVSYCSNWTTSAVQVWSNMTSNASNTSVEFLNVSSLQFNTTELNCSSAQNLTLMNELAAAHTVLYTRLAARAAAILSSQVSATVAAAASTDTLQVGSPARLSVGPAIAFLTLRITETTGDAALPAVPTRAVSSSAGSGVQDACGTELAAGRSADGCPAQWARPRGAGPPELSVYLESDAADADPSVFAAAMTGARNGPTLLTPQSGSGTLLAAGASGGAILSPVRLIEKPASAAARTFAIAQVRFWLQGRMHERKKHPGGEDYAS